MNNKKVLVDAKTMEKRTSLVVAENAKKHQQKILQGVREVFQDELLKINKLIVSASLHGYYSIDYYPSSNINAVVVACLLVDLEKALNDYGYFTNLVDSNFPHLFIKWTELD